MAAVRPSQYALVESPRCGVPTLNANTLTPWVSSLKHTLSAPSLPRSDPCRCQSPRPERSLHAMTHERAAGSSSLLWRADSVCGLTASEVTGMFGAAVESVLRLMSQSAKVNLQVDTRTTRGMLRWLTRRVSLARPSRRNYICPNPPTSLRGYFISKLRDKCKRTLGKRLR
jgi:hypothetical protein